MIVAGLGRILLGDRCGVGMIGGAIPFLRTVLFADGMTASLRRMPGAGRCPQTVAGAAAIVMVLGHRSTQTYWLLVAFPILTKIA